MNDYFICFNDVNDRERKYTSQNTNKHYIQFKSLNNEQKVQEIMSSGLNNLKYTILEKKIINDMVEVIKVEI